MNARELEQILIMDTNDWWKVEDLAARGLVVEANDEAYPDTVDLYAICTQLGAIAEDFHGGMQFRFPDGSVIVQWENDTWAVK